MSRIRSLCGALLVLDVGYCALALLVPGLPAWKMYESAQRSVYVLRAEDREIDPHVWAPRSARDLDEADVIGVARWLCRTGREKGPLRFDSAAVHRTIEPPRCVDHATP